MNFVEAVASQKARTANGMNALKSSASKNVDFFYAVGGSRGKDIVPAFTGAFVEDRELALRIAQWARDARGGAGERKLFRDILVQLEKTDTDAAKALIAKVPEIGRWDDLLVFTTTDLKAEAYALIAEALAAGNKAKELLKQIDTMTEEDCQKILDAYNSRNEIAS
jgi:hypothetical protein